MTPGAGPGGGRPDRGRAYGTRGAAGACRAAVRARRSARPLRAAGEFRGVRALWAAHALRAVRALSAVRSLGAARPLRSLRPLPAAGPRRSARPLLAVRPRRAPGPGGPRGRDRGSAALEYLGVLPILLLVALAGIQLGLVAYTATQAGTAARAAARAAAKYQAGVSGQQAGQDAVSDWLQASISVNQGADAVTATADVQIPSLIPGLNPGSVERSATMPMERESPAGDPTRPGGR